VTLDWRPASINAAVDSDAATVANLLDGRAWSAFCEAIRVAGEKVMAPDLPGTALDRSTGFRHLLAMLQVGLNQALATPEPHHPSLAPPWRTDVYKYGHDCPDALYRSASINGVLNYRVSGTVGTARYLSFQVEGPNGTVSNLRDDEMEVAADGSFVLWVGPVPHDSNWLETTVDADQLFVRQFFSNWATEAQGTFRIECLDDRPSSLGGATHPGRPERVAAQIEAVGRWFEAITDYYLEREVRDRREWRNAFMPARTKTEDGGANDIILGHGHFDLDPGAALLVEVRPARARYWSLDLANPWRESLDYAQHVTSLNGDQAVLDDDGYFRAVVAHRDPGVPNWLDTMGHQSGAMIFRWVVSDEAPEPVCTVVPHSDIRGHLPATTPVVTRDERTGQIAERYRQVMRRFSQ
jgi:hypothetical protein